MHVRIMYVFVHPAKKLKYTIIVSPHLVMLTSTWLPLNTDLGAVVAAAAAFDVAGTELEGSDHHRTSEPQASLVEPC